MNSNAPQGIVRALLSTADQLSRMAYADHEEALSTRFAALRTELARIERRCGAVPPRTVSNVEMDLAQEQIRYVVAAAAGHEPKMLLDRMLLLSERLRPPRTRTILGLPFGHSA